MIKHEKSCGALVYRRKGDKTQFLLIQHRNGGHWAYPKGHVEQGENEYQTALREIKEETGLTVDLLQGFRQSVEYSPMPDVEKEVVYFLASPKEDGEGLQGQEEEVMDIRWVDAEDAERLITHDNDQKLMKKAKYFLMETQERK